MATKSKRANALWDYFEKTGSIKAFLMYHQAKSRVEGVKSIQYRSARPGSSSNSTSRRRSA